MAGMMETRGNAENFEGLRIRSSVLIIPRRR